ncbi:MAG: carbohydrate ABC transporter substrate-binding protein, partial [Natronospirillum sp.]
QDVGSWTYFDSTPLDKRTAAWLWGQFTVAKTVSLEKTLHGLTPIRESDIFSDAMTAAAPQLGGLVEFYRSPEESRWSPTGTNIPNYPRMAPLWWQNLAPAVSGQIAVQSALNNLAEAQDNLMAKLAAEGDIENCEPRLNPMIDAAVWLDRPGAPKAPIVTERVRGQTVDYDQLIQQWETIRQQ